VVNILTALGFGIPLAAYFWFIHLFSLDVIVSDQLSDLAVISHSYTHLFDWNSLWAQHNENRILFPNLIVVLLAHTASFDVRIEEYLSAAMLVASTALLIWSHKRRSPATPWLYYCPIALLSLSVVQWGNMFWGFQMAWFLVLVSLAAAIALIDRISLTWLALAGAIAAAVIGSFSSLQGLLIWPAGLILLYHRRRSRGFFIAWIAAAVVSTAFYFYHFNSNAGAPYHAYLWRYPLQAVKFYLFAVGDIVGVPQHYNGPGNNAVLALGVVLVVLSVVVLVTYGIRREERGGSPIGVALIVVGLLFVGTVTAGRIIFGYSAASQSRYTTYDLLIPIGIVLALLDRPSVRSPRSASGEQADGVEPAGSSGRYAWLDRSGLFVARWIMAVVITLQIVLGTHYGLEGARANHTYQVHAVQVLKNIDHSSNNVVTFHVDVFSGEHYIRQQVRIAQRHHLSVFARGSGP
jgi:hypothetical protein